MAYLFSDYSSSMDPLSTHLQAASQQHACLSRNQQVTTASRFHPYGRFLEHQTSSFPNDVQEKYKQYFEHSLQLPVYGDVMCDVNKPAIYTPFTNNMNYNYPNLNFLDEVMLKPEEHSRLYNETFPVNQTHTAGGHQYPNFGCNPNFGYNPNFGQYYQQEVSRRTSPPEVGPTRTRDKYRVVYTDEQKVALEEEYEKTSFITETRRAELAHEINLSERQIKFWFQNRRVKDRRGKTSKAKKLASEKVKVKSDKKLIEKHGRDNVEAEKRIASVEELENLPPCRYSNVKQDQSCPVTVKHGDKYTQQPGLSGSDVGVTYGCDLQATSFRYPVSPSEWNGLSETSLLTTLNVSPILSSVENETRS